MLIVEIKNNLSIDRALKILKNKVVKTGMIKELRNRQEYKKKSERRRDEIKKAVYVQKLRDQEQQD